MAIATHPFSQEEVMAYLDGELAPERAVAASRHLEQCLECRQLAADFKGLSRKLAEWETGATEIDPPACPEQKQKRTTPPVWKRPAFVIPAWTGLVCLAVVVAARLTSPERRSLVAEPVNHLESYSAPRPFAAGKSVPGALSGGVIGGNIGRLAENVAPPPPPNAPQPASGPLIIRTAQLQLTSTDFGQKREQIERITNSHGGYLAQLQSNTPGEAGRSLNAEIRVPSAQLDAVLEELRRLGHITQESQNGDDVTQRYVDINARLSNLRVTEARLLQILRERTGRLSDVLQVEEGVDRTRGEIETTEAEQKSLSNQIAFAAIHLTLSEEYKTPLKGSGTAVTTRLRNAAVDGYRNVASGIVSVLSFLLSEGPSWLLIFAAAFFPARWVWRKRARSTVG